MLVPPYHCLPMVSYSNGKKYSQLETAVCTSVQCIRSVTVEATHPPGPAELHAAVSSILLLLRRLPSQDRLPRMGLCSAPCPPHL